jgi:Glycosyl transferase family 2
MKIVMTMLVRDEADILDENIRFHYMHGVDHFLIMDNLSCDATADIARKYVRAGIAHYEFQAEDTYAQGRWVTGMARRAYDEFGADWVINSDADEFWMPRTGSLKDALSMIAADVPAAKAERTNFVPHLHLEGPFWQHMIIRYAASKNALGEPLQAKVAHRASPDVVVAYGNHYVTFDEIQSSSSPAPIDILHFPVRSLEQYTNKIVRGARALAKNTEVDSGIGRAWRHLYDLYTEGRFHEACSNEFLSQSIIDDGLASGSLLYDDRLMRALAAA